MNEAGKWLPPLLDVDGDEEVVLQTLYEVFKRDFILGKPLLEGCKIAWATRLSQGRPYDEGFIHIVTTDSGSPHMRRMIDPPRAARVCWCAPMILNIACPTMLVWDYKEGTGRVRKYLWRRDMRYLVVLEKQTRKWGQVYYLVTAYHVNGSSTEKKLQQKYSNRVS